MYIRAFFETHVTNQISPPQTSNEWRVPDTNTAVGFPFSFGEENTWLLYKKVPCLYSECWIYCSEVSTRYGFILITGFGVDNSCLCFIMTCFPWTFYSPDDADLGSWCGPLPVWLSIWQVISIFLIVLILCCVLYNMNKQMNILGR